MVKVWFSILKGDWLEWVYAGPPLVNELFTYNNPNRKVANSILAGLLFYPLFLPIITTKISWRSFQSIRTAPLAQLSTYTAISGSL